MFKQTFPGMQGFSENLEIKIAFKEDRFNEKNYTEIFVAVEELAMYEAHKRFFEISRLMQGDAAGHSLMEDVLNACFDYSLVETAPITGPGRDRADRLVELTAALQRCNHYISTRFSSFEDGLFQGVDQDVSSWSDDLAYQILANRPN